MMRIGGGGGVAGVTTSTVIGVSTFTVMEGGSGGCVPSTYVFTSRLEETGTGMLSETGRRVDPTGIGVGGVIDKTGIVIDKTGIGRTVPNQCLAGDGFSSIFIATINSKPRFAGGSCPIIS